MSLRKNTLWNLAGSGLPLIAAVFCIPYLLKQLGNEAFGVLTLIWALIGYFSLFDMGVGRALTYELSKLRGEAAQSSEAAQTHSSTTPVDKNTHTANAAALHNDISHTLKAGLLLTLAAGAVGAGLMLVLAPSLATQ